MSSPKEGMNKASRKDLRTQPRGTCTSRGWVQKEGQHKIEEQLGGRGAGGKQKLPRAESGSGGTKGSTMKPRKRRS